MLVVVFPPLIRKHAFVHSFRQKRNYHKEDNTFRIELRLPPAAAASDCRRLEEYEEILYLMSTRLFNLKEPSVKLPRRIFVDIIIMMMTVVVEGRV